MNSLFVILLFCHLIGDFILQPNEMVVGKEKYGVKGIQFYFHLLIHFVLVLAFTKDFQLAFLLALLHGVIDVCKIYFQNDKTKSVWFFIDQALHLIVILFLSNQAYEFVNYIFHYLKFFTFALALTIPSAVIIKNAMLRWSNAIRDEGDSLSNAGMFIGILERLLIFAFIILNHWEAIGFLIAAKSIFRFGDLTASKDRKLTEYILIGTLLSFGIAICTGLILINA